MIRIPSFSTLVLILTLLFDKIYIDRTNLCGTCLQSVRPTLISTNECLSSTLYFKYHIDTN